MRKKIALMGLVGMLGCVAALCLLCAYLGSANEVLADLHLFFTGKLSSISRGWTTVPHFIGLCTAVLVVDLGLTIVSLGFIQLLLKKATSNSVDSWLDVFRSENNAFRALLFACFAEEVGRYFFIGLLPKVPGLDGVIVWYALMLLSNTLWALLHLYNYRDPSERQVLRVLPQFLGGLVYSYLYWKCGFLAVLITHFSFNAVIAIPHKRFLPNTEYLVNAAWRLMSVLVAFSLMTKPLTDLSLLLGRSPTFALPGWTFVDYLLVMIGLESAAGLFFDLLLCETKISAEDKKGHGLFAWLFGAAFVVVFYLGVEWALFKLIGTRFEAMVATALIAGSLFVDVPSGNALARSLFRGMMETFIILCVFHALGFWLAVLFVLVNIALDLPRKLIMKLLPQKSLIEQLVDQMVAERNDTEQNKLTWR